MVTKQEELIYHAFRSPSVRQQEREEIERKTQEFLRWKRNGIQVIAPGVSGIKEYNPSDSKSDMKTKKDFYNEIDIAGKKYGKLTAIKRYPTRAMAGYWVFVCDCGHRGTYERRKVMDGMRTCCDTCKKAKVKLKPGHATDLTGMKFNSLTVISRAQRKGDKIYWDCVCDCGGKRDAKSSDLVNGAVKMCSSCSREKFKAKRKVDFGGRDVTKKKT